MEALESHSWACKSFLPAALICLMLSGAPKELELPISTLHALIVGAVILVSSDPYYQAL